jgi:hypothetical protein
VPAGAKRGVELPQQLFAHLSETFLSPVDSSTPHIFQNIFDETQEWLFTEMEKNSFQRFLKSELYKKAQHELAMYKMEEKKKQLVAMFN